jgi:hypothetical protein
VRHAYPSPRPANPSGLAAHSFQLYVNLCAQHRAETTVIPEGLRRGWPTNIDFDALPSRVSLVRARLEAMINDPTGSPFYQDTVNDLMLHGALHISSIMGQYNSFDKSRPG